MWYIYFTTTNELIISNISERLHLAEYAVDVSQSNLLVFILKAIVPY